MAESSPGVVIRVDGGRQIGSGHVVRCITLARELARRGCVVRFVCREVAGHYAAHIQAAGFAVDLLPVDADDAAGTHAVLRRHAPRWLIVDHYGLGALFERAQRDAVPRIMVIDDLADRDHDCDLLLDQNYLGAAGATRYSGLVPANCRQLLGPQHALLQEEYALLRATLTPRGTPRRVLVFFGGSDASNETARALEGLLSPEFADLAIDVVLGGNHPDPLAVQALAARHPGVTVHRDLATLAGLMLRADVALGAGGTTTWERLALELPTAVVTVADNQRAFTAALAEANLVQWIGEAGQVTPDGYAKALRQLLARQASHANLVDGAGARRVAEALLTPYEPAPATVTGIHVVVLAERTAWINDQVRDVVAALRRAGHGVILAHESQDAPPADVCILLSWARIVDAGFRQRYRHTVVAHASDLPRGRGWSPMAWEILQGADQITVSLIEAAEKVDAGVIYLQERLTFAGHELLAELQCELGAAITRLCVNFANACARGAPESREQQGAPSYHARRTAADSALDPHATLAAQFNLLRIVDNDRYPAFFDLHGHRYLLTIRKEDSAS